MKKVKVISVDLGATMAKIVEVEKHTTRFPCRSSIDFLPGALLFLLTSDQSWCGIPRSSLRRLWE